MIDVRDFFLAKNNFAFPREELVMYAKPPYWIGRIISHTSEQRMSITIDTLQRARKLRLHAHVPGYYIVVLYARSLEPIDIDDSDEERWRIAHEVFQGMANFYHEHVVRSHERIFMKYKIPDNTPPTRLPHWL